METVQSWLTRQGGTQITSLRNSARGQYDQRILEVLFESETQEVEQFDHDWKKHSYLCLDMLESLPCIPVVRRDTILFGAISTDSRIEVDSPISHFAGGMVLFLCVAILWNIAGASAVPLIVGGKGYVLSEEHNLPRNKHSLDIL